MGAVRREIEIAEQAKALRFGGRSRGRLRTPSAGIAGRDRIQLRLNRRTFLSAFHRHVRIVFLVAGHAARSPTVTAARPPEGFQAADAAETISFACAQVLKTKMAIQSMAEPASTRSCRERQRRSLPLFC